MIYSANMVPSDRSVCTYNPDLVVLCVVINCIFMPSQRGQAGDKRYGIRGVRGYLRRQERGGPSVRLQCVRALSGRALLPGY